MKRFVAIGLGLCTTLMSGCAQQVTVVVSPFDSRSGISSGDADTVTELFMAELAVGGSVKVIDRAVFDKALRDMKFQAADWADPGKVIQLGRALKADSIIRGTVMALGGQPVITATVINAVTGQPASPSTLRMAEIGEVFDKLPRFVKTLAPTLSGKPAPAPIPADFALVPGGTFLMGSPAGKGDEDERPQHSVTVKSFYMSKYEVTQKEWREMMGTTVRQIAEPNGWDFYGEGDHYPMYDVSWYDAVKYCNKRSRKEGLPPAYTISGTNVTWNRNADGYRLPTEAEWEYACRGGTGSRGYTYAGSNDANAVAWYFGNSGNTAHEVGKKAPNELGLYDMSGNVWEWCWDWYGDYSSAAQIDPAGVSSGSYRVYRGGCWDLVASYLVSASRDWDFPSLRDCTLGFRLLRPAP